MFLAIGVLFGLIAALMAYLITYNEWIRHYPTKKEPRAMALKAAIITFVFFLVLAIFLGLFLRF